MHEHKKIFLLFYIIDLKREIDLIMKTKCENIVFVCCFSVFLTRKIDKVSQFVILLPFFRFLIMMRVTLVFRIESYCLFMFIEMFMFFCLCYDSLGFSKLMKQCWIYKIAWKCLKVPHFWIRVGSNVSNSILTYKREYIANTVSL